MADAENKKAGTTKKTPAKKTTGTTTKGTPKKVAAKKTPAKPVSKPRKQAAAKQVSEPVETPAAVNQPKPQDVKQKPYDLVLFGATGFTGELTAEYLARAMQREQFTWAIAGRNKEKLARVKKRLESINPACRDALGMIEADVSDQSSLDAMADAARAVITTVGPYILFGEGLVKACVNHRADYVDLTGEPEFVELMVERYDDLARKNGVRIVNCCGFDSIPHDLGAFFTVQALNKGLKKSDVLKGHIKIEGFVRAAGRFSGGTWHSAVHAFSRFREFNRMQKLRHQKGRSNQSRKVRDVPFNLKFRNELGIWGCPFPTIDPQVVKRSARALPEYGEEFQYGHYVQVKKLPRVLAGAVFVGGVFALAQFKSTKNLLLAAKPQGDGPSEFERARAWFKVAFMGERDGKKVRTLVKGGDPGYAETSKMLAESALCLVNDRADLPKTAGVITPAVAMGQPLLERLQAAGISFEIVEG